MSGIVRIYLNNIEKNCNFIRSCLNPKQKICASVKADAYGHGLRAVVQHLKGKVDYWGIAAISEAKEILTIDAQTPILCYTHLLGKDLRDAVRHNVELCVGSLDYLHYLTTFFSELYKSEAPQAKPLGIHFMVETGMGRLGFQEHCITEAITIIQQNPALEIVGICSHFSDSSSPEETEKQHRQFKRCLQKIPNNENYIKHIANSGAIIANSKNDPYSIFYDMVRPGIILYGMLPSYSTAPGHPELHQAMQLIGHIAGITRYPPGQPISYMSTYTCPTETNIAVVNLGYGDGLMRSLSNSGVVSINNRRYNIVGTVCMDMVMLNLGNETYPLGTEVVFFGNDVITTGEQAAHANTISYVLTTQVSKRPQREYIYS